MAELRISQASRDVLKARLATPEGQKALNDLARLIAQTALEVMPPDLLATLESKEGMAAFRAAWLDIVDAFLFRRPSKSAGPVGTRMGVERTAKRRRIPAK